MSRKNLFGNIEGYRGTKPEYTVAQFTITDETIEKIKKLKSEKINIPKLISMKKIKDTYSKPELKNRRNNLNDEEYSLIIEHSSNPDEDKHINYRLIYQWLALESLLKPTFRQCCMLCTVDMNNIQSDYNTFLGLEEFEFTLKGALRCEMSQEDKIKIGENPYIAIRRLAFGTNKGEKGHGFESDYIKDNKIKNNNQFSDNLNKTFPSISTEEANRKHYRRWKGVVIPKVFENKKYIKTFLKSCPVGCWSNEKTCPFISDVNHNNHNGWWCLLQFNDYDICITQKHILDLFNFYDNKYYKMGDKTPEFLMSDGYELNLKEIPQEVKKVLEKNENILNHRLTRSEFIKELAKASINDEEKKKILESSQLPLFNINKHLEKDRARKLDELDDNTPLYKDSLSNILSDFFSSQSKILTRVDSCKINCCHSASMRQNCETKKSFKDTLVFNIISKFPGTPSYFLQSQPLGVSELIGIIIKKKGFKKIVNEDFIYLDKNFKKQSQKGIMVSSVKGMFRQASAWLLEAIECKT
ncbi:MAG: hypothetical protein ABRQ39_30580, partial [Candidatus Eremiobacterota bacterium]